MFSKASSRRVIGRAAGLLAVVGLLVAAMPAQAITYGHPDTAHPFVGAIVVESNQGWTSEFCSGTLIAPRVFLTAGHCTTPLASYVDGPQDVHISFGDGDARGVLDPSTWHDVQTWVTNPDYWWGPMSDPHDVGVVILKDPVTNVGYGHLAPEAGYLTALWMQGELTGATKFLNVGYGSDQNMADTNVREYSWSSFRNLHFAWLYMSQNVHTGNAGTCFGDSGGPTIYVTSGGDEYVVAVTSWGDAQCKSTNNNYRVDTAASLAFIGDMMDEYT